jgi:DNA-binding MarR family transcriptional regulator
MLFSGCFGGFINYLFELRDNPEKSSKLRSVFVGIGASFLVPLFLNMISSDLIRAKDGKGLDDINILVFAGFCLIAAISSSAFIRTLSDKILKEVKEAKQSVKDLKQEVEPVINKETEQDADEDLRNLQPPDQNLEPATKTVLKAVAFGQVTLRSVSGIAHDTHIEKDIIRNELAKLISAGLITQVQGRKGARWAVTTLGKAIAEKIRNN